ncbi:hypothetical protein MYXO_01969 [Myxococcaceae bacterium]|nr:hypothetical protein MYXO_01969 [Myxococcaceae bacterium]
MSISWDVIGYAAAALGNRRAKGGAMASIGSRMREALGVGLTLLLGSDALALDVRGIETKTYAGFTRVIVETSGPAKPVVVPFPAEPASGKPERIALDFPGATLEMPGPRRIEVKDGRIDAIRFGTTREGGVRVVVDLVQPTRHRALRRSGPPRIELDVLAVP